LALFILAAIGPLHLVAASGTSAGPIKILAMGQVDPAYSPLLGLMNSEPAFSGTLVICRSIFVEYTESEIHRFIRIYFPRSYDDLIEYDFFVYDQPILTFFDDTQIEWMYRAMERDGTGALAFTISQMPEMYMPWMNSILPKGFPHDQAKIIAAARYNIVPYDIQINDDESLPSVLKPFKRLGIENVKPFGMLRLMFAKEGTTEWARAIHLPYAGYQSCPLFVSWEYGEKKSRIWATANQFHHPFWDEKDWNDGKERYAVDIFSNIVLYSCRRRLPEDVLMVHRIRGQFSEFKSRMGMLYSLLDFIERFGANTRRLQRDISQLNSMQEEAKSLYLSQDFEGAMAKENEVAEFFSQVEAKAVKLKAQALVWVYLVEYLAVSGTVAMVAFATWSLMVRRRLYRAVKTTRYSR